MAMIMQGDAYSIPVEILADDGPADETLFDEVEIVIGRLRKTMSSGEITYDKDNKVFLFPVSQAETFAMAAATMGAQARVKPKGSNKVIGIPLEQIQVNASRSKEVL